MSEGLSGGLTFLAWPDERPCPTCTARAVHLCSTGLIATYECRGTPIDAHSAYGPPEDHCGLVFDVERTEEEFKAAYYARLQSAEERLQKEATP